MLSYLGIQSSEEKYREYQQEGAVKNGDGRFRKVRAWNGVVLTSMRLLWNWRQKWTQRVSEHLQSKHLPLGGPDLSLGTRVSTYAIVKWVDRTASRWTGMGLG